MHKTTSPAAKNQSNNHTKESSAFVDAWEKISDPKQKDQELDSFLAGRKSGMKEFGGIIQNLFDSNVKQAKKISEELFHYLLSEELKPMQIHIKSELVTFFRALFIVDNDIFLSDNFRKAFSFARSFSEKAETENFSIAFSFMGYSDKINYQCIDADGYFLRYESENTKKRRPKTKSRVAQRKSL